MGTLVAATKIWTGETLTGAAVEGSERALRSPAYGGWWGGGVKMTPPTRPLRRAAQPAGPRRVSHQHLPLRLTLRNSKGASFHTTSGNPQPQFTLSHV